MRNNDESRTFHRVKDLVGATVKGPQGEEIGEINEVLVNPQSGEILAAFEVEDDRQALVPVKALRVTRPAGLIRNAEVTLNMSKQAFLAGPTVGENEWNNLDDPSFTKKIYSHYRVESPSAVGAGDSMGGMTHGRDSSRDSNTGSAPSPNPNRD